MSSFVENATKILEAAEAAMRSGAPSSTMTILIRPEGTLELVTDSESPLDTLQMERGAAMAYRVTQRNGRVRVEGRSGSQKCLFHSEDPKFAATRILAAPGAPPTIGLPLARIWPPPPAESD